MWVIRNTVQLFYSWLLSFYLKYNCNYLSCYFKWRRRNFLNTVEYVLVLSGCPCLQFSWIHVSLSGLPLTKQATTGFGQHLEVAKGKFFVPARQNAVFPHFVSPPPFFLSKFRWNWTNMLECYSLSVVFIVVTFFQASDISTTSYYGMHSSIFLVF